MARADAGVQDMALVCCRGLMTAAMDIHGGKTYVLGDHLGRHRQGGAGRLLRRTAHGHRSCFTRAKAVGHAGLQMIHAAGGNTHVVAVRGNFDDAKTV